MLIRVISGSLKRPIARDSKKTLETPVYPGPSFLTSNILLRSPQTDAGWSLDQIGPLLGPAKRMDH